MVKCNSEYLMDSANNRDVIKCYCSSNLLYIYSHLENSLRGDDCHNVFVI